MSRRFIGLFTRRGRPISRELNRLDSHGVAPLHGAVYEGNISEVRRLLEAGADPNLATAQARATSLHLAASGGNVQICKMLLESGARMDLLDRRQGLTPVHWAIRSKRLTVLRLFLSFEEGRAVLTKAGQSLFDWTTDLYHDDLVLLGTVRGLIEKPVESDACRL